MKKPKNSEYAYGWMYYRAVRPTGIKNLDGSDNFKTLKIYNASDKDPELSLKIKGVQYVFVPRKPEPEHDVDLNPGDTFWAPISKDEIKMLVDQRLDAMKKAGKGSRAELRRAKRDFESQLKGMNVIRTVNEPTNE